MKDQYGWVLSCEHRGACVVFGSYVHATSDAEPMVATETASGWARAKQIALPQSAVLGGHKPQNLIAVACACQEDCVATPVYSGNGAVTQAVVIGERRGGWNQVSRIGLPRGTGSSSALLASLACTSAGNCTAVGDYGATLGPYTPIAVTEVHGVWGRAEPLALPVGTATSGAFAGATLRSVACPAAGECTAVGDYRDRYGNDRSLVATETRGVWQRPRTLAPPADAEAGTTGRGHLPAIVSHVWSVACASAGNCTSVGDYTDNTINGAAMVATETHGVWGPARKVSLPADATRAAHAQVPFLLSVSYTGRGSYVAVGIYSTSSATPNQHAMVVTLTPT